MMFSRITESIRGLLEAESGVIYVTDPKTGKKVPYAGTVTKGKTRKARGAGSLSRRFMKATGTRSGAGHRAPKGLIGDGLESVFGDLVEEVRWLLERRSKEQQYRGLARMTKHNVIDVRSGELEKDPVPRRTRPAPKKGWDTFPGKVKAQKDREARSARDVAAASPSLRKKAVAALRAKRDEPTMLKKKRAAVAGRAPIRFPKDR